MVRTINSIEYFTKTGNFHTSKNIENQDAFLYSNNQDYKIISLADGVSSCANSKLGAEIACKTVNKIFLECGSLLFDYSFNKMSHLIMNEIFTRLSETAQNMDMATESFASTLSFACLEINSQRLLTFQLGDSNLYTLNDDGGINADIKQNEQPTFTIYNNAAERAVIATYDASCLNGVLLCSDGAWREFYDKTPLNALKESNFAALRDFFTKRECEDDCSYILMKLNKVNAA